MSLWNSNTEPGQPCERRSGIAFELFEGWWMKCRSTPPICSLYCGKAFSFASHVLQLNLVSQ